MPGSPTDSPSTGHRSKGVGSSTKGETRTHARDRSKTSITNASDRTPSSGCSTPQKLNINKDLPDLPPASTGIWGSEPALEVLRTEVTHPPKKRVTSGLIVTTSDVGSFTGSWFDPATWSEAPSGWMVPDDSSSEECSSDTFSDTSSFLTVTPTIRRIFAWELDITLVSSETQKMLNRVDQDGPFPCPQRDCRDVLLTREAYTRHAHIHIIHDGLRLCELCGARFIDDDHKDEHLNSCPKLPTFHDIESFNAEPEPVGHLQNILNLFR